jgi:lysozyme
MNITKTYSDACVELVKKWESFRPRVYKCSAGVDTIGFGHALKMPDDHFLAKANLSFQCALKLLKQDLDSVSSQLNSVLKVDLQQQCYDALCSLVFNVGITNFKRSKALVHINNEDFVHASEEMFSEEKGFVHVKGVYCKGLHNRRLDELKLWCS